MLFNHMNWALYERHSTQNTNIYIYIYIYIYVYKEMHFLLLFMQKHFSEALLCVGRPYEFPQSSPAPE